VVETVGADELLNCQEQERVADLAMDVWQRAAARITQGGKAARAAALALVEPAGAAAIPA
jgi:hypothetical protein